MKTFNVKVSFTPAYHAATNGAIEKRHQTIKNSLRASLVDMGNQHGDKWISALPWVLLGKRIQVQPDLSVSAAQLVFGKSLSIPGQLLGQPGAPLSNLQTKALLEELYKLSARPPIPTSTKVNEVDLSYTKDAKFVYVKVDEPSSLAPRFEGPYPIVSRPSRSTIEVRIGSFANGNPRLQIYNWNLCKIAHLREGATVGQRPQLGRPSKSSNPPPTKPPDATALDNVPNSTETLYVGDAEASREKTVVGAVPTANSKQKPRGKIQTTKTASRSPSSPQSEYTRPVRTTRNPSPNYVD